MKQTNGSIHSISCQFGSNLLNTFVGPMAKRINFKRSIHLYSVAYSVIKNVSGEAVGRNIREQKANEHKKRKSSNILIEIHLALPDHGPNNRIPFAILSITKLTRHTHTHPQIHREKNEFFVEKTNLVKEEVKEFFKKLFLSSIWTVFHIFKQQSYIFLENVN